MGDFRFPPRLFLSRLMNSDAHWLLEYSIYYIHYLQIKCEPLNPHCGSPTPPHPTHPNCLKCVASIHPTVQYPKKIFFFSALHVYRHEFTPQQYSFFDIPFSPRSSYGIQ
jgi:hypothetical protein